MLKILIEGNQARYEKFYPDLQVIKESQLLFCDRGTEISKMLQVGADAEILLVDAISIVKRELIEQMPKLKMIHSEGVAYNGIDLEAATERGIYVCNNKGCNAGAVAEQAIMLMLQLLRKGITGDRAVRAGQQMEMKEYSMVHGITELSECKVGLIGFGDIAKATAQRLYAFGCEVSYYSPNRKSSEIEANYHVKYEPLIELTKTCDMISIHTAVTKETEGMINQEFLNHMKKSAYLINTARGEIVDNIALRNAITTGKIAGAGLDTLAPEPMTVDNPLIDLPEEFKDRVILAPHLGGITTGSFKRAHKNMWQNVERVANGEKPINVVNIKCEKIY